MSNAVLPARLDGAVPVDRADLRSPVDPPPFRLKIRVVKIRFYPNPSPQAYFVMELGLVGSFPIGRVDQMTIPQVISWAKFHGAKLLEVVMDHWPLATEVIQ